MKHLLGVLATLFGLIITGYGIYFAGSAIEIMTRPGDDGFAGIGAVMGVVITAFGIGVLVLGSILRKTSSTNKPLQ